jgi:hypothetical protein
MSGMSTLERMECNAQDLARKTGAAIANTPQVYFSAPVIDQLEHVQVSFSAIEKLANERGRDASRLVGHAAVHFVSMEELRKCSGLRAAGVYVTNPTNPSKHLIHYPSILLGVNPKEIDRSALQTVMRHEVGHMLQGDQRFAPPYHISAILQGARAAAGVASMMALSTIGAIEPQAAHDGATILAGCAGFLCGMLTHTQTARAAIWLATPREIGADLFAYKHRKTQLIMF